MAYQKWYKKNPETKEPPNSNLCRVKEQNFDSRYGVTWLPPCNSQDSGKPRNKGTIEQLLWILLRQLVEMYTSCNSPWTAGNYSTSVSILLLRNGCVGMVPGALWALLLSFFLLSASIMVRLSEAALYIGFGKCLCLPKISQHCLELIQWAKRSFQITVQLCMVAWNLTQYFGKIIGY